MSKLNREDLLGYVLGALDAQEQQQIQQMIDQDANLEDELLAIKNSLAPLEILDTPLGPPPGLARRTCQWIATNQRSGLLGRPQEFESASELLLQQVADEVSSYCLPPCGQDPKSIPLNQTTFAASIKGPVTANAHREMVSTSRFSNSRDHLALSRSWSVADLVTLCGVALVLSAIMFPAISSARFQSRIYACRENLRSLHQALLAYSDINPTGEYIRLSGKRHLPYVGLYARELEERGLLRDVSDVRCPGLGDDRPRPRITPAYFSKGMQNPAEQVVGLKRGECGDFAYSMDQVNERGQLQGIRPRMSTTVALLGDAPSCNSRDGLSLNHEGRKQNILFNDGHIETFSVPFRGQDHFYFNDAWNVSFGMHPGDSVLAAPHLRNDRHAVEISGQIAE